MGRAGESPEHDVKLLTKRWELCVVVRWRRSEWMVRALVLIINGQTSGDFSARELKKRFYVTVADAKEFFETTPGVLRVYVKPAHLDALTFNLQVKSLDGELKTATIKPIFLDRHIFEEYTKLQKLEAHEAKILHCQRRFHRC